jgi:hypothetical protein
MYHTYIVVLTYRQISPSSLLAFRCHAGSVSCVASVSGSDPSSPNRKASSTEERQKWVCLKMGYTPNEIAIKSRDNDQQNHWV